MGEQIHKLTLYCHSKCCFKGNQNSETQIRGNIVLEVTGVMEKCYCESGISMSQLQIVRVEI